MVDFVKMLLDKGDEKNYTPIGVIQADERAVGPYTGEQESPIVSGGYTLAPVPKRKPDIAIMNAQEESPAVENKPAAPAIAPQEQNLKEAEQALQEAQEADAKSGSEGYEAKENGIFSRIRQFGDGIAYTGQLVNKTLEDMARSPFSKFVDPTTLLGGRRTMVNDIDSYFNQQGLPALRNELLAQDIARLKTPIGQAEEWAKKTPEQQAAMKPYFEMKGTGGYTGVGAKNPLQAAQRQVVGLVNDGVPMQEALQQVSDETGIPANEILYGATSRPNIKTPLQLAQRAVVDRVSNGENLSDALQSVAAETGYPINVLSGEKAPSAYKPTSAEEKLKYEELKKGQDLELTAFDKLRTEIDENAKDAAMNAQYGRSLNGLLDEAAVNGVHVTGGGDLGKALRRFGANYGLVDPTTKQLVSGAAVLSEAIFGNQIANIIANQNRGNITERERDLFARQAINLGNSEEETRLRLDLYVLYNELAINRARKLESLSNLDPLEQSRQFRAWQNDQYDKTASLVKAVVDSHLGTGSFDKREREYNGGI